MLFTQWHTWVQGTVQAELIFIAFERKKERRRGKNGGEGEKGKGRHKLRVGSRKKI